MSRSLASVAHRQPDVGNPPPDDSASSGIPSDDNDLHRAYENTHTDTVSRHYITFAIPGLGRDRPASPLLLGD